MRIAYLTNIVTGTREGGGNVHVTQIARGLMKRGHILYTNIAKETDNFIKLDEREFFRRGKEIDLFYIRIDGWHEREKLTLLRMSNTKAPCIWELNAPLEEMRLKGISESHLRLWNVERKDLAGMVDYAICVSEEMGRYAREFLDLGQFLVIPNGSDPDLFIPNLEKDGLLPTDRFNVMWVGSAEYPWQGIEIIRNVAESLWEIDKDIAFFFTTTGEDRPNLFHLGKIPYDRIPQYLASAHVGLCIYDLEKYRFTGGFYGSALKLFDYMSCGLPVLGTDVGQIRTVIERNRCGLLTDNSIGDIVEKLIRLKQDPSDARAMGSRGRAAVVQEYSWNHVVDRTEKIMLDLLATGANGQRKRMLRNRRFFLNYRMKDIVRRIGKKVTKSLPRTKV